MVAELVETSRLWGRTAARIDPRWVEPLAEHLVKRTYDEPRWEKQARVGRGHRAGDALRPADRRRPRGRLRRDRPGALRATCSSAARWSRATGTRATASSPPTARWSRRSRRSRTAPAGATSSSTTRRCTTSTPRAIPETRRLRRALRPLVARRAPRAPGPADVHARAADQPGRGRGHRRAAGHLEAGRARAAS